MSSSSDKKKLLFICLGNICRSPIAEAVFNKMAMERGVADKFEVDSAAIGDWHRGKSPDHRAIETMKKHNVPMNHRARQITKKDFTHYDVIFGMDDENISDLEDMKTSNSSAKLELFGSYDPRKQLTIRDPYYDSGDKGFEDCYVQCLRCAEGFLDAQS